MQRKECYPLDNKIPITSNSLPVVLSVQQLAEVLQIGRNAAYQLVNTGQIRSIRIGRTIRIPQAALLEYLNQLS